MSLSADAVHRPAPTVPVPGWAGWYGWYEYCCAKRQIYSHIKSICTYHTRSTVLRASWHAWINIECFFDVSEVVTCQSSFADSTVSDQISGLEIWLYTFKRVYAEWLYSFVLPHQKCVRKNGHVTKDLPPKATRLQGSWGNLPSEVVLASSLRRHQRTCNLFQWVDIVSVWIWRCVKIRDERNVTIASFSDVAVLRGPYSGTFWHIRPMIVESDRGLFLSAEQKRINTSHTWKGLHRIWPKGFLQVITMLSYVTHQYGAVSKDSRLAGWPVQNKIWLLLTEGRSTLG